MRDSTTPTDIPIHGTDLVAGYANGSFKWSADGFARFSGIPHIRIDPSGMDPENAEVLDVERDDADVPTAVIWAKKRKRHFRTAIRRSSTVTAVRLRRCSMR